MDRNTPIRYVPMVGPIYSKRLEKLGILTAGDLLMHIPTRYEDLRLVSKIENAQEGEIVTIIGSFVSLKNTYTKRRKQIQQGIFSDETGQIEVLWFNQPYIVSTLSLKRKIALSGKIVREGFKRRFISPDFELIHEDKPLLHTGRLVPIYSETAGVSSKWLRSRIHPLLLNPKMSDDDISKYLVKNKLTLFKDALMNIHFPQTQEEIEGGRRSLAFKELLELNLSSGLRRLEWNQAQNGHAIKLDFKEYEKFLNTLPFTLTNSQKRSCDEILEDLTKTTPMNRLLQGDVGSGKTVVAALCIYACKLSGFQSLLMAPTEILVEQHFETLKRILSPLGLTVGIQTRSKKMLNKQQKNNNSSFVINNSKLDVLIGTHALLEDHVKLPNINLIIIDEQHRFGVRQRTLLRQKGKHPHVLTMTATPIPRTLALTQYGDLDLSTIDELPPGRTLVKTWVIPPQKRTNAYAWIKKRIQDSNYFEKAFIVCPFIDVSENIQSVKAVTQEFQFLQKEVFPDLKLGLLHGRMSSKEKNSALNEFKDGAFHILVTTPVVEVGIDIPSATVMVVEGAERFGLAQIHQLRGRVGRSTIPSFCLLFTSNDDASTSRLKNLEKYHDGAQLSEIDYKIRGPGSLYGAAQHGRIELKITRFEDNDLNQAAKTAVNEIITSDPQLNNHPYLKARLKSSTMRDIAPD